MVHSGTQASGAPSELGSWALLGPGPGPALPALRQVSPLAEAKDRAPAEGQDGNCQGSCLSTDTLGPGILLLTLAPGPAPPSGPFCSGLGCPCHVCTGPGLVFSSGPLGLKGGGQWVHSPVLLTHLVGQCPKGQHQTVSQPCVHGHGVWLVAGGVGQEREPRVCVSCGTSTLLLSSL